MNALNLPEFKVIDTKEDDTSILFIVEPKDAKERTCFECHEGTMYKHAKTKRFARDLNAFGKLVGIEIHDHRLRCNKCGHTLSPIYLSLDFRGKVTQRLVQYVEKQALKRPFADIARELDISDTTVKRIFEGFVRRAELSLMYKAPRVLGIDEAHLNKEMRAVFTDIDNKQILEILPKRNKDFIKKFLEKLEDKENIEVVTTDMWKPYRDAVYDVLPYAYVVVDKFHVIQLATKAMEDYRKLFRSTLNDKQRKKLMHSRFLLLKNKEDLSNREQWNLEMIFAEFPQLREVYALKEGLRDLYNFDDREEALKYFEFWKSSIPKDCKPFLSVAKTIDNWKLEIFNYFIYRYTNAYTESANNIIKTIEKAGRGYSFEVLRAKVLFGTKATSFPKYTVNNYYITIPGSNPADTIIHKGFGVDIPQLMEIFESDEF